MVKKVTKSEEVDEAPVPKKAVKKAAPAEAAPKKAVKKEASAEKEAPKKKKIPKELGEGDVNMQPLSDICAELGINQRKARIKLRKSEFNAGDGRWAWELGSKELAAVVKFLTPAQ